MLKHISAAVLLLAVATLALGQPKPADKQSEFAKLQVEYNKATQEYYKPYQNAKSPEESAKIKLDPAKNPAPVFLPRYQKLAENAGATEDGFRAWVMVKQLAESTGDKNSADKATDVLMTTFIETPWMSQFASMLPYSDWELAKDEREKKIGGMLMKIEKANRSPEVKATAMYSRAQLIGRDGNGDTVGAAKLYKELTEKYAQTEPGKRAGRDLFEMENLVPGKPAPNFEALDEDGKKFKLSDYRGKVVVLDFWGFW
jgi:hypothetical protein